MEKKEVKKSIVSWRALIIGMVIIGIVNAIFAQGLPPKGISGDWITGWPSRDLGAFNTTFWLGIVMIFIVAVVLMIVNSIGAKPLLNRQEVVTILFMASFGFVFVKGAPTTGYLGQGIGANMNMYNKVRPEINWIDWGATGYGMWAPNDPTGLYQAWDNSVPVNLAAWATPIAWTVGYTFFYCILFMFIMFLFVGPLVTAEALGVPGHEIFAEGVELIRTEEGGEKKPFLKRKWFWLGIIIGMAVSIQFFIDLAPWRQFLSVPSMFRKPDFWGTTFGYGDRFWEKDLNYLLRIQGVSLVFIIWPSHIGWGLIWPWDVLLSFWIVTLLMSVVLGPLFQGMGIWPAGYGSRWLGGTAWQSMGNLNIPEFIFYLSMGVLAGLIVLSLWRGRSTMGPIMTALFKKSSALDELDKNAPLPYRYCWIGLIVSAIVFWALHIPLQTSMISVSAFVLLMIVSWIGLGRVVAEASQFGGVDATYTWYGQGRTWSVLNIVAMQADQSVSWPTTPTPASAMAHNLWQYTGLTEGVELAGVTFPLWGWKLADVYKINKRVILIASIVAIATAALISAISFIAWFYAVDWTQGNVSRGFGTPYGYGIPQTWWYHKPWWSLTPSQQTGVIGTLVVGFIIAVAAFIGRERVGLLRWLSVPGIFMGIALIGPQTGSLETNMESVIGWPLFAIVIRWISMRLKGPAWTRANIAPLGVGMILGMAFWTPFMLYLTLFFPRMWGYSVSPFV